MRPPTGHAVAAIDQSAVDAVELWAAPLPIIGWWAWHHWLVTYRSGVVERWEIWQRPNAGGTAFGHLHRNLLPPSRGVGGGPAAVVRRWTGPLATGFIARIVAAPVEYPYLDRYRFWPGPNSNTYVQWVLDGTMNLGRQAIGSRYGKGSVRRSKPPILPA